MGGLWRRCRRRVPSVSDSSDRRIRGTTRDRVTGLRPGSFCPSPGDVGRPMCSGTVLGRSQRSRNFTLTPSGVPQEVSRSSIPLPPLGGCEGGNGSRVSGPERRPCFTGLSSGVRVCGPPCGLWGHQDRSPTSQTVWVPVGVKRQRLSPSDPLSLARVLWESCRCMPRRHWSGVRTRCLAPQGLDRGYGGVGEGWTPGV